MFLYFLQHLPPYLAGKPDTINPQYRSITTIKPKPAPCIYDARVSYGEVANKLITLKTNEATGPDGISPRLLQLLEHLSPCR